MRIQLKVIFKTIRNDFIYCWLTKTDSPSLTNCGSNNFFYLIFS